MSIYLNPVAEKAAAEKATQEVWAVLGEAYGAMAAAFNRIHGLPRSEDTAIADRLSRARGKIEALKAAHSQDDASDPSSRSGRTP